MTRRITFTRNHVLGTVLAAPAEEAITVAIRDFGITDPVRPRALIAQRVERA